MNVPTHSAHTKISIVTILCFLFTLASADSDTISLNQTLSGKQTIVSANGTFELGFFTPGNSFRYYIGVWHRKVSQRIILWVANREAPVLSTSDAQLKILHGNLVLLNESQYVVWSTNQSTASAQSAEVVAVLLDTGNLVLQRSGGSSDSVLWQSFENPSHVWMPGMKLGYNKRTGKKTILTSWKNSQDPAPGLFSHEPVPNTSQYVNKWNGSQQYWISGEWNGHIFSRVPEMRLNSIFNFSYVDNANESYFIYTLYNRSLISITVMDVSGQYKQLTWMDNSTSMLIYTQPKEQCDVYAYCGAFGICSLNSLQPCACLQGFKHKSDKDWSLQDYSGGCVRETNLHCIDDNNATSKGTMDKFLMQTNVKLPFYSQSMTVRSIGECESACLSNCSCSAYANDNNECLTWQGELLNIQQLSQGDGSGKTIYIRHSPSSSAFVENRTKKNKAVVIGAILGAVFILVAFLGVTCAIMKNRRRKMAGVGEGSLVAFSYKVLQVATKNFSVKLGEGGFGSVFKGTLADSTTIAVKKLETINQGEKQFRTEVSTIGTIQHLNLVRLWGFCMERDKKLLVYDYMENGSLNSHLFGVKALSWKLRYDIALGVARGLVYLHEKCRECIIHCDIKPENILLDANFCPMVGDFGLAKLVGHDFSRVLTTIRGTRGYLAPEWISGVAITAKADVYSYGMMALEVISGKRNSEYSDDSEYGDTTYFPYLAARVLMEGGDVLSLLDEALDGDADVEEVSRLCKVACWCIQDDENIRPSMSKVLNILEGLTDVDTPSVPPSLQLMLAANPEEHVEFFTTSSPPKT